MNTRNNFTTRNIVDNAITALPLLGVYRTAKFLCDAGIPSSVAMRVILLPDRRRSYKNIAITAKR